MLLFTFLCVLLSGCEKEPTTPPDQTRPITITSPSDNATVTSEVTIRAVAGTGYVFNRVDFYIDNDSVYSDSISPYLYLWDTSIYEASSTHDLQAIAYDDTAQYESSIVTVIIGGGQTVSFTHVSSFALTSAGLRVATEGGHLYIAGGTDGLYVVSVVNPASPEEVYRFDSPGEAKGVDSGSPYLVLADGDNGVQLFDISDPDNVIIAGSYNTSGNSWNTKVSGNTVYIADNDALQIASISSNTINPVTRLPISDGLVKDLDAVGATVFVMDINGLTVVDASSPGSPDVLSRYTAFEGFCQCVFAVEGYVFVGTSETLAMLSASDPSNLISKDSYIIPSGVTGVFANGSIVFISTGASNGGVMAFDYSSGESLVLLDQYIISEVCYDITVAGNCVFLAGQTKVDIFSY